MIFFMGACDVNFKPPTKGNVMSPEQELKALALREAVLYYCTEKREPQDIVAAAKLFEDYLKA